MVALTLATTQVRDSSFGVNAGEIQTASAHTYTMALESYFNGNGAGFLAAGPAKSTATWTVTVNGSIWSALYGAVLANGYGAVSHRVITGTEGAIFGDLTGVMSVTRATITNAGVIQGGLSGVTFSSLIPDGLQSNLRDISANITVGSNLTFGMTDTISISNAATAQILGGDFGIVNYSFAPMIVTNAGEITGGMSGFYSDAVKAGADFQTAIGSFGRLTLNNQATGVVDGGVTMGWVNNTITNAGIIYGAVDSVLNASDNYQNGVSHYANGFFDVNNDGVFAASEAVGNLTGLTMINSGFIYGEDGYFDGAPSLAIYASVAKDSVTNTGTIFGFVDLSFGNDTLSGAGTYLGYIQMGFGNDTATISGRVTDFFSATGDVGNGGGADNDVLTVTVNGRIEHYVWMGGGNNTVTNQGTIIGFRGYYDETQFVDYADVAFDSGNDVMTNSGRIGEFGNYSILPRDIFSVLMSPDLDMNDLGKAVDMWSGNDSFVNSGILLGYVEMGAGNDTFSGGANVEFLIEGDGADIYRLGAGNDAFRVGDYDNAVDTILGGDGRDVLTFIGYSGDGVLVDLASSRLQYFAVNTVAVDTIREFEQVIGSDFDDQISGSAAAETVVGGLGNDVLNGRGGKDVLIGGDGADEFKFDLGASGTTRASRDVIMDFEQGDDQIWLNIDANTAITGSQAFAYDGIEFGAFDRVAGSFQAGQLRFVTEGGNTILRGDTNGDGRADFSIELRGTFALTADDFLIF